MPLTIPPAVNYPGQLIFRPNTMLAAYGPPPGPEPAGSISVEIDWGTMGGTDQCVNVAPNANTANQNQISQIAALYVDNSDSQADVRFVFSDSGLTITIPAFSGGLFPVVTSATSFFVEAGSAISSDQTRFLILNVNPPPVELAQPAHIQEASVNNNIAAAAGTTALIAPGIYGTLEAFTAWYNIYVGSGNQMTWELVDGNSNVLMGGQFSDMTGGGAVQINANAINLSDMDLPFENGLNFVQTLASGAGFTMKSAVSINLLYSTP